MSGMFGGDPPKEDPSIAAERAKQQKRAEEDRQKSIQEQLGVETTQHGDFGTRSLLGPLGSAGGFGGLGATLSASLRSRRSLLGSG